jgi:hypothetical protein
MADPSSTSTRPVWRSGIAEQPNVNGFTLLMAGGARLRVRLDSPSAEPTRRLGDEAALAGGLPRDGVVVEVYGPLECSFAEGGGGHRDVAKQTQTLRAQLLAAGPGARQALVDALGGRWKRSGADLWVSVVVVAGLGFVLTAALSSWPHNLSAIVGAALLALLTVLSMPLPRLPVFVERRRLRLGLGPLDPLLMLFDRTRLAILGLVGAVMISYGPVVAGARLELPLLFLLALLWCAAGLVLVLMRYYGSAKLCARLARDEGAGVWYGLVAGLDDTRQIMLHANHLGGSYNAGGANTVVVDIAGKTVVVDSERLVWTSLEPKGAQIEDTMPMGAAPGAAIWLGATVHHRVSSDDGVLLSGRLEPLPDGRHRLVVGADGPTLLCGFPLALDPRDWLRRALLHYQLNVAVLGLGALACLAGTLWAASGVGWL